MIYDIRKTVHYVKIIRCRLQKYINVQLFTKNTKFAKIFNVCRIRTNMQFAYNPSSRCKYLICSLIYHFHKIFDRINLPNFKKLFIMYIQTNLT